MFILDSNEVKSSMFAKYLKVNTDLEVCHKRIDHINFQKLQSMKAKGVVVRLSTFTEKGSTGVCEACQFGKQCQHPFPNERNVSKGVLDVVHSDVIWGPAQTTTFGICQYYVTFTDDFSRHTCIYPMRQKNEVFGHFQKFKSEVEKATGRPVRCLRSDGGKEYFSDDFTVYLRKEGIRREFTFRHTTQQNGVTECKNWNILGVARAMINEKHMPKSYWAEAANTAIYLMNRCTTSGVHEVTQHEKYFGKKPNLSHARIFAAIAYVHIPDKSGKS